MTYVGDLVSGVQLQGVTSNSAVMNNTQVASGRFITDIEDQKHMDVVFIGADFKDRFFPNVDAVGKTIGIDGRPFEVIVVAQPRKAACSANRRIASWRSRIRLISKSTEARAYSAQA